MSQLNFAGYILRSNYRRQVFSLFSNKLIMPSQIAKELDLRFTHITRELRFLKDKELIECINPKDKTGRLYRLTLKGQKLKKEMEKEKLLD